MKIPLFDIDWTLLKGGDKALFDSYNYVLNQIYNQPTASRDEIKDEGLVFNQVMVEILKLHKISEIEVKQKLQLALSTMEKFYYQHPERRTINVLPGVVVLLNKLKQLNIPLGILTGNAEPFGWDKLKRAGIREYFSFEVFGNFTYQRADLIPIAKQKAETLVGKGLSRNDFFIVGDSPLDIICAKTGKIKIIAVASGRYTFDELKTYHPDLLLTSLLEMDKFINAILH